MTKCLDIIYSTSNTYVYFRNIGPNFLGIGEKESKQLGNDKFLNRFRTSWQWNFDVIIQQSLISGVNVNGIQHFNNKVPFSFLIKL